MSEDYSGAFAPAPEDPQGILGLPETCDLDMIEPALRAWAASLNGADGLKLAALREQVCRELKARGVSSAAKMVDAALSARPAPAPTPSDPVDAAERSGAAREAGREVLEHPRPLELLERSLRGMGLGGSLVIPKTVYLAATTRLLSATLNQQAHLHVLGPASSGKSFEADAALAHLPELAVVRFDGASPRALIYHEGEIQHRVLLYAEMDSIPSGSDDSDASNVALSYLRTLCSSGKARYSVVQKNKDGGMSTVHYEREGPAVVIVTGTKPLPDEQLRSRVHEVEVRVDRARLGAVLAAQGTSLAGHQRAKVDPALVAAQEYLQTLAPLDVYLPFAPELARRLFERVRLADPRLTRELSRVAGFTAAHAVLCIERRRRAPGGAVLAELEDYAAARDVVRELSTTREYSNAAIEVWEAVSAIQRETSKPVTATDVRKRVLKDKRTVNRSLRDLLDGGALEDHRDAKAGRNAPYILTTSGERPDQTPLPKVEELAPVLSPPAGVSHRGQVDTTQEDRCGTPPPNVFASPSSMTGNDLTPVGHEDGGGSPGEVPPEVDAADPTGCPTCGRDACPGCCTIHGQTYFVGDLVDGRPIVAIDDGIPTIAKRRSA